MQKAGFLITRFICSVCLIFAKHLCSLHAQAFSLDVAHVLTGSPSSEVTAKVVELNSYLNSLNERKKRRFSIIASQVSLCFICKKN